MLQPLGEVRLGQALAQPVERLGRHAPVAHVAPGAAPRRPRAIVPRLRIVPDVPMTPLEAALGDLIEVAAHLLVDELDQPPLVVARQRIGPDEALGQPDDAES